MLTISVAPPYLVLSGNPVNITVQTTTNLTVRYHRIHVRIFDSSNKIIGEDSLPVSNYHADFDISDYLKADKECEISITNLYISGSCKADIIDTYHLAIFETYNENGNEYDTETISELHVLQGGVSKVLFEYYKKNITNFSNEFLSPYSRYLTWAPERKVNKSEVIWLYFFNVATKTIYYNFNLYFSDGAVIPTPIVARLIDADSVYRINVSILSNDFLSYQTPTRKLVKYELFNTLETGQPVVDSVMFYVDDEEHYNNFRQYMFRNSLGAMDFISLKGIGESQMKIARKTGFIDNAETIYNSEFQQINKVNSGWLNTSFKNAQTAKQYIIELINSKEAYEVKGSNILKISPSGKKITVSEDDEFLQSFTFEYKYVHTEINYSELLSSPVSISFPEYIHIAFDMSTGTDRTAGLNFNWTESTVLYINWGDGTEVQGFTNNIELNHTYHYFGKYYAQIWANDNNFENIEQFVADNCKMSEIIGLEKLTGLTYIDLRNNLLTGDIDLSNNTGLTTAWFMNNNLISIDLSGCSALTNIDTYDINSFKNNPNLEYLNLSGCLEFNHLYVCDTKMHTLDITGCTSLKYITIQVSNITELDITQCPELIGCTVAHNQIEVLDFANAQNLVHIQADYNNLKELENLDNLDSIDEMTLTHNVN